MTYSPFFGLCLFTATQAAQKQYYRARIVDKLFTATQAAQKAYETKFPEIIYIHRHTGGLENQGSRYGADVEIHRHTGGLERLKVASL